MQQDVSGLDDMLQFSRGRASQRDAVVVPEVDDGVAMCVGRDQRLQFFDVLRIGKLIELDRILLPIEVAHRFRTDARGKYEVIAIATGNRRLLLGLRSSLLAFRAGRLGRRPGDGGFRGNNRDRRRILRPWRVGN